MQRTTTTSKDMAAFNPALPPRAPQQSASTANRIRLPAPPRQPIVAGVFVAALKYTVLVELDAFRTRGLLKQSFLQQTDLS